MNFQVELDIFRGPIDLLLYLVRKHEVEVSEISVARITDQFLAMLDVLQEIDVNEVGDFLEVASILVEMKSRLVLPHGGEEPEEQLDPHLDLVEKLLEYKKFKDAASLLDDQGRDWQKRYARLADELPQRSINLPDQPIQELELWDLVSAFGRIIRESQTPPPTSIVYDDTPLHQHMGRIHELLKSDGRAAFSALFLPGMHKSALVGVFLGILELVRHHSVVTEQADGAGEIWVLPGPQFDPNLSLSAVDTYQQQAIAEKLQEANIPTKPR